MSEPTQWHLDKRVPVGLIAGLALQTAGIVWWASHLSARVDQAHEAIATLRASEAARSVEDRRISEALARLDERMRAQTEILQRLERRSQ
ncbi:MAG: hypothetical protein RJA36_3734 [Pseudomonadota bacterium]|jgi:hypothetical protein